MIQIWGRTNSVNVQKVLWCCHELDLPFERIDAGMQFGRNNEAAYLAINPTGRIPTLVDGEFVLWESNSIMRYLALEYGAASGLYPPPPRIRCSVDRWLDWTLAMLQPAERTVFWGLVRTPPAERDMVALQKASDAAALVWRMLDGHLAGRSFVEGETFTIGDIALGAYARRWFGVEGVSKPRLPNIEEWYARLVTRPGFQRYLAPPLS